MDNLLDDYGSDDYVPFAVYGTVCGGDGGDGQENGTRGGINAVNLMDGLLRLFI